MAEPEEKKIDVFICHNLRDKTVVRIICRRLENWGYSIWFDEKFMKAGFSLNDQVAEGARWARTAIVCVGPNYIGDYTKNTEIGYLKSHISKIIPILLPGADDAAKRMIEKHFGDVLYVDFSKRAASNPDTLELQKLRRSLGDPAARETAAETDTGATELAMKAARTLAEAVSTQGLSLFLGGTWESRFVEPTPDDTQLAEFLETHKLELPGIGNTLEDASHLFCLKYRKEEKLFQEALVGFIDPRATYRTDLYKMIAELLRTVVAKLNEAKALRTVTVFTTNIDIRLERELMDLNMPFTRVVLCEGGKGLRLHTYRSVQGSSDSGFNIRGGLDDLSESVRPQTDNDEPSERTRNVFEFARDSLRLQGVQIDEHPFGLAAFREHLDIADLLGSDQFEIDADALADFKTSRLPNPVIVKLRGSSGLPGSFALRSDQVFNFSEFSRKMSPILKEAADNNPGLFLGFSPSESIFALVDHAFRSQNSSKKDHDFIVAHATPDGQDRRDLLDHRLRPYLAENLWHRHNLRLVWQQPDKFIDQLRLQVEAQQPEPSIWTDYLTR